MIKIKQQKLPTQAGGVFSETKGGVGAINVGTTNALHGNFHRSYRSSLIPVVLISPIGTKSNHGPQCRYQLDCLRDNPRSAPTPGSSSV
jgi:hypothetical protein